MRYYPSVPVASQQISFSFRARFHIFPTVPFLFTSVSASYSETLPDRGRTSVWNLVVLHESRYAYGKRRRSGFHGARSEIRVAGRKGPPLRFTNVCSEQVINKPNGHGIGFLGTLNRTKELAAAVRDTKMRMCCSLVVKSDSWRLLSSCCPAVLEIHPQVLDWI